MTMDHMHNVNPMHTPTPYSPLPPDRLASEKVVISAPMSFAGSAQRLWKITSVEPTWTKILTIPAALTLIAAAWCVVLGWYCVFGLFLVPYRLLRRGSRKRARQALQHREQMQGMQALQAQMLAGQLSQALPPAPVGPPIPPH